MRYTTLLLLFWVILCLPVAGQKGKSKTPSPCADSLAACPEKGCSKPNVLPPDPDLNVQKNRTAAATQVRPFTFAEFVALNQKAVNKKHRGNWTQAEAARVAAVENGPGAVLVAYLYDATLSDAETCNCYRPDESDRDYHIWLSKNRKPAKGDFIVVEITPRVRQQIKGWHLADLNTSKRRTPKVRVTGLITLDNEHYDFPKRGIRKTAWEIHPVTKFEVCPANATCTADGSSGWKNLEDYKP